MGRFSGSEERDGTHSGRPRPERSNDFVLGVVDRDGPQQRRGMAWRLRTTEAKISMSEAYPYAEIFALILRNLQALPLRS